MEFKKPFGRPKVDFDWDQFNKLCKLPKQSISCRDISDIMDLGYDTIARRVKDEKGMTFEEYRDKKQGSLRKSILDWQMEAAKNGSAAVLIWLGKNYLGQEDPTIKQEVTLKDEDKTAKDFALQLNQIGVKHDEPKQEESVDKGNPDH